MSIACDIAKRFEQLETQVNFSWYFKEGEIMLKLFHSNKEEMLHHSNLFQMFLKLHSLKVFNPNFFLWMFEIVVEFLKMIYKMGSEQWHSSSQWRFFTRRQLATIISAINIIILLQPIIHKPSIHENLLALWIIPYALPRIWLPTISLHMNNKILL
jgi:hypothetical protein